MADLITVSGPLVGTEARPYAFEDERGRPVEGTARTAWIATGGQPVEVRFRDPSLYDEVCGLKPFTVVTAECELGAANNKVRRTVVSIVG